MIQQSPTKHRPSPQRAGFRVLFLVALTFAFSAHALAQQDLATLTGTISDATGAVVSGATVTIRSEAQAVERTATTSEEGTYTVPQLRPGVYTVVVAQTGFTEATASEVQIGVGQNRTLDFTLTAGGGTEIVNVTGGDAITIDTSSNRLGTNVTAREVLELPVNGRNVSQLYNLAPGAQNSGTGNFNNLRFNARSNQQNQQRLDGIEATAIFDASPGYITVQGSEFRLQTSLENIQEFRVDSSNYPAEYGTGTGGQINIVGKSGGNDFTGSLFEYFRNDKLDARNFFDGADKSKLRLNQFGGSVGGRIIKDRLFFFGSYEGLRQRAGFPSADELTLSPLARNFINFYGTNNPLGEEARVAIFGANSALAPPTPSAALLARIQNLRATNAINVFPVGNIVSPPFAAGDIRNATQGIRTNSVAALNEDAFSVRFDGNIDQAGNFRLFTRYQRDTGDLRSPDGTTGRFIVSTQQPDNFVTSLQQIYGTNIVNETKIGFNRAPTSLALDVPAIAGLNGIDITASTINLTGSFVNPGVNGAAATGFSTPGGLTRQSSAGNGRAQPIDPRTFTLVDNLSVVAGNHTFKFGGEFRNILVDFDQLGGTTYSYSNVQDFLLNQALSANFVGDLSAPGDIRVLTNPITTIPRTESGVHRGRQHYLIGYAQDQWQIRPNVTINYGLRYEYYSPNREQDNRVITFDRNTLSLLPRDQDFYRATKNNFGPRIALTYAPARFNNRTVFRIGGGIYYGPGQYEDLIQPIESDVFRTTSTFANGLDTNTFNTLANPSATAAPLPFQARSYDVANYRVPERVGQYGASIQQQLPGNTVLTVAYVGSQGRNLFQRGITNRILRGQTSITTAEALPTGFGVVNRTNATTGLVENVTTIRETTILNRTFDTATGTIISRNGSALQPFAELDYKTSGGRDSYNSLQVTANRRFTQGLTLGAQYQWGHSIGTTQGSNEAQTAQDPYDFASERGNNTFDIRHSANVSVLYELPVGENRRLNLGSFGNSFFRNFQIGGIYNGRTGTPLDIRITRTDLVTRCERAGGCPVNNTVTVTRNAANAITGVTSITPVAGSPVVPFGTIARLPTVAAGTPLPPGFVAIVNTPGGNASRNTRRPDYVAGANPYTGSGGLNFLNPGAFTIPQPGSYGNLGRNALTGPSFNQFDLTLQKRFQITEGTNIEFRSEIYNVFNKANFSNPQVLLTEQLPSIGTSFVTDATTGTTRLVISGVNAATGAPTSGLQPGQPFRVDQVPQFGSIGTTVGRTVGLGTNRQIQFSLRLNF